MKIYYTANHNNIKGNEFITVEQLIRYNETIQYEVILNNGKTNSHQVLLLTGDYSEAIKFADNYQTD